MAIKTYRYILQPPSLMVEEGTGPGQGDIQPVVTNGRIAAGRPGAAPTFDYTCDEARKEAVDQFYSQFGWTFLEEVT